MVDEDAAAIARAIEASGEFELVRPNLRIWALIAFTYFDTRWTPIAGVNVYDLDHSVLATNGFVRNSAEAFPLIRVAFLMRGMLASCGVEGSMVARWERAALAAAPPRTVAQRAARATRGARRAA